MYRACFEQLVHQNEKYYKRFPQDVALVCDVVNYLAESEGGGVRNFLNGEILNYYFLLFSFHLIFNGDYGQIFLIQSVCDSHFFHSLCVFL